MSEQERKVKLGEKDGHLMTTFQPPIHENKLLEATSSAFSIEEIIRDRENDRRIWGVMYDAGDPADFEANIAKLKEDVEANTGYRVADEVIRVGATATEAAVDTATQ